MNATANAFCTQLHEMHFRAMPGGWEAEFGRSIASSLARAILIYGGEMSCKLYLPI